MLNAPGPDGFSIFFFNKKHCNTIKGDMMLLMNKMSSGTARLDRLNFTNVVLIPKRENTGSVADFCLISFLTALLKLSSTS